MWYFLIRAKPQLDSNIDGDAGGAYVNCWINFRLREGAKHLAKFYLGQEGWETEEVEEAAWVEKETYQENPEGLEYFQEAEADGASFVLNEWPIEEKESAEDEGSTEPPVAADRH